MLYLNEILYHVSADEYVTSSTTELPASVTPENLASYLEQRYGAEPLDVVRTDVPDLGVMTVGWTFPLPHGPGDARVTLDDDMGEAFDADDHEIMAVPMLHVDDGDFVPLFAHLAQQRTMLEGMADDGEINRLIVTQAEAEEWQPDDRDVE